MPTVNFYQTDAGRSRSRRPKQNNDCVVRTFAMAFGKPYDQVYDELAQLGRKSWRGTTKMVWRSYLGQALEKKFPAVKGQRRMTVRQFAQEHSGTWVLNCAKHMMAVKDGQVFDDAPPRWAACVYSAFEVK